MMAKNDFIPGPRTSAKNANDPRVKKTLRRLRQGYIELLDTVDADDISVLKLSEHSGVDRKTFYLHYRNMDDMKNDVIDVKSSELTGQLTGDFENDIETIYQFLDSIDEGLYKLLTTPKERDARDRLMHRLFTSDAFCAYYNGDDDDVVEGYLYSIIYIYEENRRNEDPLDTIELAHYTAQLLMNGINGVGKSERSQELS